jgi:uncharacterized repeat protein (TIGR01451 family)
LLSTLKWTGADAAVSTNWSDANNWDLLMTPVAGDTVIFDNTASNSLSTVDAGFSPGGALLDIQITWNGTISVDPEVNLLSQGALLQSGTLGGTGTFTSTATFDWTGGQMSDAGTTQIDGDLTINGANVMDLINQRTLGTAGTATWTSGRIRTGGSGTGVTITNTGTWDVQVDDPSGGGAALGNDFGGPAGVFNNPGTLRKSGGSGVTTLRIGVINSGTVAVQAGTGELFIGLQGGATSTGSFAAAAGTTLVFEGGGSTFGSGAHTFDASSTVTAAGTIAFASGGTTSVLGTYNVTGATSVTGGTVSFDPGATLTSVGALFISGGAALFNVDAAPISLDLSGGVLGGPATVTVSGASTWSGGQMSDAGTTQVNGDLTINGAGVMDLLNQRTLGTAGTTTWTNGRIRTGGSGTGVTITNTGTWEVQVDDPFGSSNSLGNDFGGTVGVFNNQGTSTKSAGTATTSMAIVLTNTGTLTVAAGRLAITNSGSAGGTTVAGLLDIQGGVLNGTGTINADVNNAGAINPGLSPGLISISGNYTQSSGGSLNVEIGGLIPGSDFDQISETGDVTLDGALNVSLINGFAPADGNSFTIINNQGSNPVSGNFAGLPEGATFSVGGTFFRITYAGGVGNNDVVLTSFAITDTDLEITKSDSPDPVTVGNTLTYTLTITNHGPADATGVVATDTLRAGVTFVSASSSQGSVSESSGVVTATLGGVTNGASATVTIVVQPTTTGTITNTASVTGNETDPVTGNNSASQDTTANPIPSTDLEVTKSDSPDPVIVGSTLTYTLTITNHGPSDATGAVATDSLPAGVTFVSATTSQGSVSESSGVVTASLGGMASGATATVTIVVQPTTAGVITNTASVTGNESDLNPDNNTASQDTAVNPAPIAGQISGVVFFDFDADGSQSASEPGVAGRTVFLDSNNNGVLDGGEPSTSTDSNGNYSFTSLADGTYTVREDIQSNHGAVQTAPAGGSYSVNVSGGSSASGQNFADVFISEVVQVQVAATIFPPSPEAQTAFVRGLYHSLLGRDAEPAGEAFWVGLLRAGVTRTDIARGIWDSVEHRGIEVDSYYATFLNRKAEPAGRAFWVNALLSSTGEALVVEGFLTSVEYSTIHSSDAAFVDALYPDVLSRGPDADGRAHWLQALQGGIDRAEVALDFVLSKESELRAVDAFYAAYLHRAAETGGQQFWLNELQTGNRSFESVGVGFLDSDEYFLGAISAAP